MPFLDGKSVISNMSHLDHLQLKRISGPATWMAYVTNLPPLMSVEELESKLKIISSQYAYCTSVKINSSTNSAIITFKDQKNAEYGCFYLNNEKIGDYLLNSELISPENPQEQVLNSDSRVIASRYESTRQFTKIQLSGIPDQYFSADKIKSVCKKWSKKDLVKINIRKPYIFIEAKDHEHALELINLFRDNDILGTYINCEPANVKDNWSFYYKNILIITQLDKEKSKEFIFEKLNKYNPVKIVVIPSVDQHIHGYVTFSNETNWMHAYNYVCQDFYLGRVVIRDGWYKSNPKFKAIRINYAHRGEIQAMFPNVRIMSKYGQSVNAFFELNDTSIQRSIKPILDKIGFSNQPYECLNYVAIKISNIPENYRTDFDKVAKLFPNFDVEVKQIKGSSAICIFQSHEFAEAAINQINNTIIDSHLVLAVPCKSKRGYLTTSYNVMNETRPILIIKSIPENVSLQNIEKCIDDLGFLVEVKDIPKTTSQRRGKVFFDSNKTLNQFYSKFSSNFQVDDFTLEFIMPRQHEKTNESQICYKTVSRMDDSEGQVLYVSNIPDELNSKRNFENFLNEIKSDLFLDSQFDYMNFTLVCDQKNRPRGYGIIEFSSMNDANTFLGYIRMKNLNIECCFANKLE